MWDDFFLYSDDSLNMFKFNSSANCPRVQNISFVKPSGDCYRVIYYHDIPSTYYLDARLKSMLKENNTRRYLTWYLFRPRRELTEIIQNYSRLLKRSNSLGLQIRTGNFSELFPDRHGRIRASILYSKLDSILETFFYNSHSICFLATDSEDVQKYLFKKYPGRIITCELFALGHSARARQVVKKDDYLYRTIADILLLIQCKAVFYSRSSFGEVAKYIASYKDQIQFKLL